MSSDSWTARRKNGMKSAASVFRTSVRLYFDTSMALPANELEVRI